MPFSSAVQELLNKKLGAIILLSDDAVCDKVKLNRVQSILSYFYNGVRLY